MNGPRSRATLLYGAAVVACYVLGHQLAFLASFGADIGRGLASTGHGSMWALSVVVVAGLAVSLLLLAAHRIHSLARQTRLPTGRHERRRPAYTAGSPEPLGSALLRLWLLVLAPAVLLFILSENVEHLSSGMAVPGLEVFDGEVYGWAPSAYLFASFATAAVLVLYRWRRDILIARIAAAALGPSPRSPRQRPMPMDWRMPRPVGAGALRVRAPPREALTTV